jgi:hypothetical protein
LCCRWHGAETAKAAEAVARPVAVAGSVAVGTRTHAALLIDGRTEPFGRAGGSWCRLSAEPRVNSLHDPFDATRVSENATCDLTLEIIRQPANLVVGERLSARQCQPIRLEAVADGSDLASQHFGHEPEGLPHGTVLEDVDGRHA